jgi:5-methylcytosine-specific restriction protein A
MAVWPYNTTQWQRLRKYQLSEHPLCEACLRKGLVRSGNHVDHRVPISAGGAAFPQVGTGLATLCASCHSQKTARGPEAGGAKTTRPLQSRRGCDINGWPLDPTHPWNTEK